MTALLLLITVVLLLGIFFLSLVETATTRLSKVNLRTLAERDRAGRIALLAELSRDRSQFLLPLQFAIQILTVAVAIVVTAVLTSSTFPYSAALVSLLIMVAIVALVRQLIPRVVTQKDPEHFLLRVLPWLASAYRLLWGLSVPLLLLLKFRQRVLARQSRTVPAQEEASDEEIQAYIEVGEEEGIFEEAESELIQSAVEFGTTLVRAIMTPRPEVVAIEETATISELKDLIVTSKHSRIPVYRETMDQILGVVYVRNLLALLGDQIGEQPITPLIKKPLFVPETKRVSELLKEMQETSEPMALVVNEYGSVSGVVTIEDLIEEIVGEIHDEDETQTVELASEGGDSYIVSGGLEVEDLEDALRLDFGEPDVTTVSGLVVSHLGKVPAIGEKVRWEGMEIEILDANRKKIITMRIRRLNQPAPGEPVQSGESIPD
ncbi:MAG: hemolysin family protein [Acidobacteriota bacterium]